MSTITDNSLQVNFTKLEDALDFLEKKFEKLTKLKIEAITLEREFNKNIVELFGKKENEPISIMEIIRRTHDEAKKTSIIL